MTLATTAGVVHLPFGERPEYGQPYPEGIAVANSAVSDDASVGIHTWSIGAPAGFLYRLELLQLVVGEVAVDVAHFITNHRWATDKSGLGGSSFVLNWGLAQQTYALEAGGGFNIYTPSMGGLVANGGPDAVPRIRRFPMGSLHGPPGVDQQLIFVTKEDNVDTVTNELSIVMTYWSKQAIFLPGFLSAFYEAPAVPPLIRRIP